VAGGSVGVSCGGGLVALGGTGVLLGCEVKVGRGVREGRGVEDGFVLVGITGVLDGGIDVG
jgi:hypothetical protein